MKIYPLSRNKGDIFDEVKYSRFNAVVILTIWLGVETNATATDT
ncbi:hypothetical protein [Hymenobacter radiodurans]|nr:hypothetical protein [Hymenobacter radiodurans]